MDLLLRILSSLIFILLAGLFSSVEIAIASFGKNKIEELKEKEHHHVSSFEKIQNNLNSFFGTVQILTTAFIISSVIITFDTLLKIFSPWLAGSGVSLLVENAFFISAIISVLLDAFLIIVFAVLLPKAIGFKFSDQLGNGSVKIFLLLMTIFNYPVRFITGSSNFFLSPFKEKTDFSQTRLSEDEIRLIISEGVKSGAIDEQEQKIIDNIFEFNDLKANEAMIPRTEMSAIEISDDNKKMVREAIESGYSLIPVYDESLDKIIGVLHTKDLIKSFVEQRPINVRSLIRQAYFVPETKLISEILREMQNRGERMAIVTDEYGGTEGLITMEDILEEIVGEIKDNKKNQEIEYQKLPDGSFSVLGLMGIDDFNSTFNYNLPESENYNTVAGFVADISGKILNRGEVTGFEGLSFELVKKIRQKMVQFKVYSGNGDFALNEKMPKN
jgi:putative hemolysin